VRLNALGQPIGDPVEGWKPPAWPSRVTLHGTYCQLEPLDADGHGADLWKAFALDTDHRNWTYLLQGPYASFDDFAVWARRAETGRDPLFFTIRDHQRGATGVAAFMRIAPEAGTVEVGNIHLSVLLQRTPAATEAMYLMMKHAFALGYRRYEWKCDALNAPSRAAAERLGFTYEGLFRQALVYKGRNRDTAWYSIVDHEWPRLSQGFERWLSAENFDREGRQIVRLTDCLSQDARLADESERRFHR
jgi:RimJ/RimL family protein N-acetyltransferase